MERMVKEDGEGKLSALQSFYDCKVHAFSRLTMICIAMDLLLVLVNILLE